MASATRFNAGARASCYARLSLLRSSQTPGPLFPLALKVGRQGDGIYSSRRYALVHSQATLPPTFSNYSKRSRDSYSLRHLPNLPQAISCSPPLNLRGQRRNFHSSNHNTPNPRLVPIPNTTSSRIITITVLLICSVMYVTLYNPERSKALKPKGAECANQNLGEESLVLQYRPPIPPVTVEQAIEMLRWEESDEIVARGSGVLRFDTNRVASNMPCEDEYISAAGHDDMGTARWLIWGIFDGHR